MMKQHPAENSPLGKTNEYIAHYQPELLFAISRQIKWQELGLTATTLPYQGVDIWNGYELSWLTPSGKPVVMMAEFVIPANSPFIIESKSFKLYLNSFNQTVFSSEQAVCQALTKDLSAATASDVQVTLYTLAAFAEQGITQPKGILLDDMDVTIEQYDHPSSELLSVSPVSEVKQETLYSQLLKSNCPVTGQPDWATLVIEYQAMNELDHASLLKYIISFRQHADFHEQCIERIFLDLNKLLQPLALLVYARYVRRGGLDINPYRSLTQLNYPNQRLARQ